MYYITGRGVGPFFIFFSLHYIAPHSWFQLGRIAAFPVFAGEHNYQF